MAQRKKKKEQIARNISRSFSSAFPLGSPIRTKADEQEQIRKKKKKKRRVL